MLRLCSINAFIERDFKGHNSFPFSSLLSLPTFMIVRVQLLENINLQPAFRSTRRLEKYMDFISPKPTAKTSYLPMSWRYGNSLRGQTQPSESADIWVNFNTSKSITLSRIPIAIACGEPSLGEQHSHPTHSRRNSRNNENLPSGAAITSVNCLGPISSFSNPLSPCFLYASLVGYQPRLWRSGI